MRYKHSTIVDNPKHLLTVYDQHVLKIASHAHALRKWTKEKDAYTLPEREVLIRYESDVNHLYVDLDLFKKYNIDDVSKRLRRNTQYCGAKGKRMLKGIETSVLQELKLDNKTRHVLFFDLKKIDANRVEERRARGRPENHKEIATDILRKAETDFDRVCAALTRVKGRQDALYKKAKDPDILHSSVPFSEFFELRKRELEEMLIFLEMAKNLSVETNNLIQSYDKPLRMRSKKRTRANPYAPRDAERTRILAFEAMLKSEAKLIHREVFYWGEKDGRFGEYKREYIPAEGAEYISAYYKEWSRSDGTGLQKILWVPVALLNTYTHKESTLLTPEEKEELKYYRTDIRYVSSQVKRIGGKAQRCAKFDMRRTVNPAKEEPAREPEKNPFK